MGCKSLIVIVDRVNGVNRLKTLCAASLIGAISGFRRAGGFVVRRNEWLSPKTTLFTLFTMSINGLWHTLTLSNPV